MRHHATARKRIEMDAGKFEVSESLRQFLPPVTHFTIGIRTAWFKVSPRTKTASQEEEAVPTPRSDTRQGQ